jgi:ketosteroid isomerase-like protein
MEETVNEYYDAIDEEDFEKLTDLIDPEVVHYRPGGTLEGREEFIEFMRDERPMEETTHKVDGFYGTGPKVADETESAAVGRVMNDEDEETLFDFLDLFVFEGNAIKKIRTYTP